MSNVANLPKVLLHDHLDGGLRPQTIIDLAEEIGYQLPASSAHGLESWFFESANAKSLVRYLETFRVCLAVLQTPEALMRAACEAVEDYAADGIVYAEIRWAPEQHCEAGMTLDDAVEAVREGICRGVEKVRAGGKTITVRQLLCFMRQGNHSMEIAELASRHIGVGEGAVVGMDAAGPEAGFPPSLHTEAFACCARNQVPITCHAGEDAGVESMRSALDDAGARRFGHGTRIVEDISFPDAGEPVLGSLASRVLAEGIVLEMCPTSNIQCGVVPSLEVYPASMLADMGFSVTISTDNRLVSSTTLSQELTRSGLSEEQAIRAQRTALEGAFCDSRLKDELRSHLR